jgi:hypothetical protein
MLNFLAKWIMITQITTEQINLSEASVQGTYCYGIINTKEESHLWLSESQSIEYK